jgi:EmrB/QacA subfamily drug resistance transporter
MTPELSTQRKALATAGIMLALLLAALDQTIVGTAMPRIVADLQGLDFYAWVTTAYLVTSTVLVPIAGKLGDMFGRKPFVIVGMLGFMVSSWLCGFSQDMIQLVLFRGLQGLFGGMLFATVFTVLADIFPIGQLTRVQGLFGGVFGLSSIIGPTLGGYITDHLGWRWVFYVNVPVGVLGLLLVAFAVPFVRSKASWREIDFLGSATLAACVVPLLIALSMTTDHAWTSPEVIGLLGLAAVMLIAFILVERRVQNPVIPFDLFRHNSFTVSVTVAFFTAFGMFAAIVYVPLVYQDMLGVSATNSGSLMTPMMLGMVITSSLIGQVLSRIGPYRLVGTVGVAVMMAGIGLLAFATPDSSQWTVTRDIVIIGVGLGLTFPLTIVVVQAALPQRVLGVASSQIQFWRNLGGTVGTAIMGSILTHSLSQTIPQRIAALDIPAQFKQMASGGGGKSAQALLDASRLAQARAQLPVQARPFFDQIVHAMRLGLSDSLHEVFLIGAGLLVVALIASLFLKEVPLRGGRRPNAADEGPARPEEPRAELEPAVPSL